MSGSRTEDPKISQHLDSTKASGSFTAAKTQQIATAKSQQTVDQRNLVPLKSAAESRFSIMAKSKRVVMESSQVIQNQLDVTQRRGSSPNIRSNSQNRSASNREIRRSSNPQPAVVGRRGSVTAGSNREPIRSKSPSFITPLKNFPKNGAIGIDSNLPLKTDRSFQENGASYSGMIARRRSITPSKRELVRVSQKLEKDLSTSQPAEKLAKTAAILKEGLASQRQTVSPIKSVLNGANSKANLPSERRTVLPKPIDFGKPEKLDFRKSQNVIKTPNNLPNSGQKDKTPPAPKIVKKDTKTTAIASKPTIKKAPEPPSKNTQINIKKTAQSNVKPSVKAKTQNDSAKKQSLQQTPKLLHAKYNDESVMSHEQPQYSEFDNLKESQNSDSLVHLERAEDDASFSKSVSEKDHVQNVGSELNVREEVLQVQQPSATIQENFRMQPQKLTLVQQSARETVVNHFVGGQIPIKGNDKKGSIYDRLTSQKERLLEASKRLLLTPNSVPPQEQPAAVPVETPIKTEISIPTNTVKESIIKPIFDTIIDTILTHIIKETRDVQKRTFSTPEISELLNKYTNPTFVQKLKKAKRSEESFRHTRTFSSTSPFHRKEIQRRNSLEHERDAAGLNIEKWMELEGNDLSKTCVLSNSKQPGSLQVNFQPNFAVKQRLPKDTVVNSSITDSVTSLEKHSDTGSVRRDEINQSSLDNLQAIRMRSSGEDGPRRLRHLLLTLLTFNQQLNEVSQSLFLHFGSGALSKALNPYSKGGEVPIVALDDLQEFLADTNIDFYLKDVEVLFRLCQRRKKLHTPGIQVALSDLASFMDLSDVKKSQSSVTTESCEEPFELVRQLVSLWLFKISCARNAVSHLLKTTPISEAFQLLCDKQKLDKCALIEYLRETQTEHRESDAEFLFQDLAIGNQSELNEEEFADFIHSFN